MGATCLIDPGQTIATTSARKARVRSIVEPTTATSATIAELTRRMARGDADALAVFYEGWFDTMYHEARRVSRRDESFCLDVVQDVMLRIIRKISPMNSDAQLAAWLRRVVRSCAYDRLRSDVARAKRESMRRAVAADSRSSALLETAAADAERLEWLQREIDALDEGLRGPLLLRVLSGRTLAQIGGLLGLSPGAVDGRVSRAVAKLREKAMERSDE